MSEINKFPCIECGLCCKYVNGIQHLEKWVDTTGKCKYLQNDNLCKIYKHRPLLCNVEESYSRIFYKSMSKKEFYLANLKVCIELNEKFGTISDFEYLKSIYRKLE